MKQNATDVKPDNLLTGVDPAPTVERLPLLAVAEAVAEIVVDRLRRERVFDNSGDGFLTLSEAANHLGMSTRNFRRLLAAGKFRAYRLPGGGALRFRRSELDKALVRLPDAQARKG